MAKVELKFLNEAADALDQAGKALMVSFKEPSVGPLIASQRTAGEALQKAGSAMRNASAEIDSLFEDDS